MAADATPTGIVKAHRAPAIAASLLFGLLGPGVGHPLLGRTRRGFGWLAVALVSAVVALAVSAWALFGVLAAYLGAAIDVAIVRPAPRPTGGRVLLSCLSITATWVVLGLGIRGLAYQIFQVHGTSMAPGLRVGDRIVVSKLQRSEDPKRGEVIVFSHPARAGYVMVSRVVAITGDELRFQRGRVFLRSRGRGAFRPLLEGAKSHSRYCDYDAAAQTWSFVEGSAYEETAGEHTYLVQGRTSPPPAKPPYRGFSQALEYTRRHTDEPIRAGSDAFGPIPKAHVFVLGDNRQNSADSRFWGTVPTSHILGKPTQVLFSYGGQPTDNCQVGLRWERLGRALQ